MLKKIGGFMIMCAVLILVTSCSSTNQVSTSKELEEERWGKIPKDDNGRIKSEHRASLFAQKN